MTALKCILCCKENPPKWSRSHRKQNTIIESTLIMNIYTKQNAYCNIKYMTLACWHVYILTKYSMCTEWRFKYVMYNTPKHAYRVPTSLHPFSKVSSEKMSDKYENNKIWILVICWTLLNFFFIYCILGLNSDIGNKLSFL